MSAGMVLGSKKGANCATEPHRAAGHEDGLRRHGDGTRRLLRERERQTDRQTEGSSGRQCKTQEGVPAMSSGDERPNGDILDSSE